MVVQLACVMDAVYGAQGTDPRIRVKKGDALYPRVEQRHGAHTAGLMTHEYLAVCA